MHNPFTPLRNLHFNIDYALQFTMDYLVCVYIFVMHTCELQIHTKIGNAAY